MATRNFMDMPLEWLLDREWSARARGIIFACPSCGGRWYTHCQGCLLEKAIRMKKEPT